jgi:hypothetical protein
VEPGCELVELNWKKDLEQFPALSLSVDDVTVEAKEIITNHNVM